jgi:SAM-dependent methyltransferase
MSRSPFDHIADQYDHDFTNTVVGKAQRDMVWHYLMTELSDHPQYILELNCGTGEDAIRFAKQGHHVTATDISPRMINVTQKKAQEAGVAIHAFVWDMTTVFPEQKKYDIIYSNFGGINCVSPGELRSLLTKCFDLLTPEGKLICVVMGKNCPWERFLFSIKGDRTQANRRSHPGPIQAHVGDDANISIWYYNSEDLASAAASHFSTVMVKPVGLLIPPAYGRNAWWHFRALIYVCKQMEIFFSRYSVFQDIGDHIFISLKKRTGN